MFESSRNRQYIMEMKMRKTITLENAIEEYRACYDCFLFSKDDMDAIEHYIQLLFEMDTPNGENLQKFLKKEHSNA